MVNDADDGVFGIAFVGEEGPVHGPGLVDGHSTGQPFGFAVALACIRQSGTSRAGLRNAFKGGVEWCAQLHSQCNTAGHECP